MIRQLMRDIADRLTPEPLALALVVINLAFLIAASLFLREVAKSVERKDALLTQLAERCLVALPKKEN